MKPVLVSLVASILAAKAFAQVPAVSQTTDPPAHISPSQTAPAGAIVVELSKSLDAKKAKADDKIEARVTMDVLSRGGIVIPRGARIVGHVNDARARTKQVHESILEIAFDRLVLKNESEIPLKVTIQAIGAPMQMSAPATSDLAAVQAAGSLPNPGRNEMSRLRAANSVSSRPANSAGVPEEPTDSFGSHKNLAQSLGPASQGVVRMKGIALSAAPDGSVISSTTQNVHLGSGTQLVLRIVEPQALADSLRRTRN